jgi:hypothetical protein
MIPTYCINKKIKYITIESDFDEKNKISFSMYWFHNKWKGQTFKANIECYINYLIDRDEEYEINFDTYFNGDKKYEIIEKIKIIEKNIKDLKNKIKGE